MSSRCASAAVIALALALVACGDDLDRTQATRTARPAAPTTAELNLAQKDEFVHCAHQHDELGMTVDFRGGRAVSPGGDGGGGDFNARVSVPRAIAFMLETGGQYVGLREGDGPDMDVLIYADPSVSDLIDEQRGSNVGGSGGQNARGQWSHYTTLSVDRDAPTPPRRVRQAISTCLRRAAAVFASMGAAADRLAPERPRDPSGRSVPARSRRDPGTRSSRP